MSATAAALIGIPGGRCPAAAATSRRVSEDRCAAYPPQAQQPCRPQLRHPWAFGGAAAQLPLPRPVRCPKAVAELLCPYAWPKVYGKTAARLWRQLWLWSCVVAFVVGGVPVVIVGGQLGGYLPPECSAAAALSQARKQKRACISCMLRLYSGTAYQNQLGPADGRSCC